MIMKKAYIKPAIEEVSVYSDAIMNSLNIGSNDDVSTDPEEMLSKENVASDWSLDIWGEEE